MNPESILGDVTRECISLVYEECRKEENKNRVKLILDTLTELIFADVQPYLYTILCILVTMFVINCFQFYYYTRLFFRFKNNFSNNNFPFVEMSSHL
jgi:hypothetical protein